MSITLQTILWLVVGAVLGWLLRAIRPAQVDKRIEEELRAQRTAQEADLNRVRAELTASRAAQSAAEAARSAADSTLAELKHAHQLALSSAAETQRTLEERLKHTGELLTAESIDKASVAADLGAQKKALAELRNAHEQCPPAVAGLQTELLSLKHRNGELEARVKFLDERLTIERQQIEAIQDKFR